MQNSGAAASGQRGLEGELNLAVTASAGPSRLEQDSDRWLDVGTGRKPWRVGYRIAEEIRSILLEAKHVTSRVEALHLLPEDLL